jgi:hypothetical protein
VKKKHLPFLILLATFPLILLAVGLYLCSFKRGFTVEKISSTLAYNEEWETTPLSATQREHLLNEVLCQTFYCLGSGRQGYTFASQDNKYVLKFFKMHKILPKNWLRDFPFSLFEKYRLENVEKRQDLFENIFRNFKAAFEQMPKETGLVYLHLNKTRDLKTKIKLVDHEGKKWFVDLDGKEFVVQLKAQRVSDYLLDLKENEEELRFAVRSLLQSIAALCMNGYCDRSIDLCNNFGFAENQAILFDFTHFYADESLKQPRYLQAEVLSAVEKISQWAERFNPDLVDLLQEEAHSLLNTLFPE